LLTRLSPRLEQIAAWVPPGARLLDVGTDHALLPITLVERGRVRFAIASDIAAGPLASAQENVARARLTGQVSVRRGPGLTTVQPGEVDTVTIAGMGGATAASILLDSPEVLGAVACVILQPMNATARLRATLRQMHFSIQDEQMIAEADRTYQLILATPRTSLRAVGTDQGLNLARSQWLDDDGLYADYEARGWAWLALEFGPRNLQRTHDVVVRGELQQAQRHSAKIIESMSQTNLETASRARRIALTEQLAQIEAWLEWGEIH